MWECWRFTPVEDVAQYYTPRSTLKASALGDSPTAACEAARPDSWLTQTIVYDPWQVSNRHGWWPMRVYHFGIWWASLHEWPTGVKSIVNEALKCINPRWTLQNISVQTILRYMLTVSQIKPCMYSQSWAVSKTERNGKLVVLHFFSPELLGSVQKSWITNNKELSLSWITKNKDFNPKNNNNYFLF